MSLTLPLMPCPACGVTEIPRISAGTGPRTARLDCAACGTFIKWAPRVLAQQRSSRETRPMGGVNKVILVGAIGRYGVTVNYAASGTPCASFTVVVTEQGQDGKEHATFIECEVWGKKAEAASEVDSGQLVLLEGRLRKRQKGEAQWEMVVSGYELTPIVAPVLTGTP